MVQALLSRLGYQLVYYGKGKSAPPSSLDAFFLAIKGRGFVPLHIIDVGSNRGQWTRRALKHFPSPPCRYTLIEPQSRLRDSIRDLETSGVELTWIEAGAGDAPGRMNFHVPQADTSASFVAAMAGMQAASADMTQVDVEVVTLDDVIVRSDFGPPQLVKIDAEGFDLKVIDGARSLLGVTELFLIEVSMFDERSDSTLARVVRRMDEAGYAPIDITDLNRCAKSGVLWLCEIVFARKGGSIFADLPPYVSSFTPPQDP